MYGVVTWDEEYYTLGIIEIFNGAVVAETIVNSNSPSYPCERIIELRILPPFEEYVKFETLKDATKYLVLVGML